MVIANHLDVATTKCGFSAGKTSSTANQRLINFLLNDLKTKNTTFLNLHFNKKFSMNLWKSNHRIDITNSLSFDNFLKEE